MSLTGFVLYFGLMTASVNPDYKNITFSENIEYCTNIIHNPNLEDEFNSVCSIKETNDYIMMVKRNFN